MSRKKLFKWIRLFCLIYLINKVYPQTWGLLFGAMKDLIVALIKEAV